MSNGDLFSRFLQNIEIANGEAISSAYGQITTRLNKDFWESEADDQHRLQVGSMGRNTAIDGISDLDMVFELPWATYQQYNQHEGNGQSQLLQAVRNSLLGRYPDKEIGGDGQVVKVPFAKFDVEVLPAFRHGDGSYTYADANDGGSWRKTNPRAEIAAMDKLNKETSYTLKRICKMLRAWKNEQGVAMSGWLIDTLAYNFFNQTEKYRSGDHDEYDELLVSLFSWLGGLEHQDYWLTPGSGVRVPGAKFQSKAKKAAAKCAEANRLGVAREKAKLWKQVFGPEFPSRVTSAKAEARVEQETERGSKEVFIEEMFSIDIRYHLVIDCDVKHDTEATRLLRRIMGRLPHGRSLRFFIAESNIPEPYDLYWKVRNVGQEADRSGRIRGEIDRDRGRRERGERTDFFGDHFVEAFAIKNDVCVARDRIDVPII